VLPGRHGSLELLRAKPGRGGQNDQLDICLEQLPVRLQAGEAAFGRQVELVAMPAAELAVRSL